MADFPKRSHGRVAIGPSATPRDLMAEPPTLAHAWRARIVTLFPELFPGPLGASLTGKALSDGAWALDTIDLRRFGLGKHRQVDDTPAGGGAGLVMRADVLGPALATALQGTANDRTRWPRIYLSPRGRRFDQSMARRFSQAEGLTLLCGRFEGIDERVIEAFDLEEVSIGDFVMTGGEIAAYALLDATVRLIPGVLGNAESIEEESFSDGLLEHPHYTRPAIWQERPIPDVLLSGNHRAIAKWRRSQAEARTRAQRPDLWAARPAAKATQD